MSDSEQQDILERGLASPFWQVFTAHVNEEWGAGGKRFERTLTQLADQTADDATLVRQMQQVAVTRREVLRLLAWPEEELRKLTAPPEVIEPGRAPVNEELIAGQSRRGGL